MDLFVFRICVGGFETSIVVVRDWDEALKIAANRVKSYEGEKEFVKVEYVGLVEFFANSILKDWEPTKANTI